jgi:hypothetical protein
MAAAKEFLRYNAAHAAAARPKTPPSWATRSAAVGGNKRLNGLAWTQCPELNHPSESPAIRGPVLKIFVTCVETSQL